MKSNVRIMLSLVVALMGWTAGYSGPGGVAEAPPKDGAAIARPGHISQFITLQAIADFEKNGCTGRNLIIKNSNTRISVNWSYDGLEREIPRYPFKLKPDFEYIFTIKYEHGCSVFGDGLGVPGDDSVFAVLDEYPSDTLSPICFVWPRIAKVTRNGKVIYDQAICEVHNRKMDYKEVPILYGLIKFTGKQPTGKQWKTVFPHPLDFTLGGCMVKTKKTTFMYICPDCKAAYEKWKMANPDPASLCPRACYALPLQLTFQLTSLASMTMAKAARCIPLSVEASRS